MSEKTFYEVLGVDQRARQEEVQAAFEEALVLRRSRRGRTSDLVAAHTVLSQPALRRAYDLTLLGSEAGERIQDARSALTDMVKEHAPDVNWAEVGRSAWLTVLKATVVTSALTARMAEATAGASRSLHRVASDALEQES